MTPASEPTSYLLGDSAWELERLGHQHEVWRPLSEAAFDRAGVGRGARILDAGCGPGLTLADLMERIGGGGEAWGVDQSAEMLKAAGELLRQRGLGGARLVQATLEEVELPAGHFDFIWLRWVLTFPREPELIVQRLARALRPGGGLWIQDYDHDGVGLFPRSEAFGAALAALRGRFRETGGDLWVGTRLPAILHDAGLVMTDFQSDVLAGGPISPIFQWGRRFFVPWSKQMVAADRLSLDQAEELALVWEDRARDPHSLFFSPILVTAGGRRPA